MMRTAFARRASLHSSHLFDRTVYRRGVEVAIWGMPIVSVDAMRQAFFPRCESQVRRHAEQRFIDMAGTLFDGSVHFDDTFFDSLARMVDEEPIRKRDLVAMGQLHSIGIQKGRPFTPDRATRDVLRRAADEAHLTFMENAMVGDPFWPDKHWLLPAIVGPKTGFGYETGDRLEIDQRGTIFFLAFAAPKKLGATSFSVGAFRDDAGDPFRGDKLYRLHVPASVPARQSWSATIYDAETSCFIRDSPRLGIDSSDPKVHKNANGSVEVFVGPNAPAGREHNWLYTKPGKHWFSFFRFYGPEKPLFEKSWKLMDFEKVQV